MHAHDRNDRARDGVQDFKKGTALCSRQHTSRDHEGVRVETRRVEQVHHMREPCVHLHCDFLKRKDHKKDNTGLDWFMSPGEFTHMDFSAQPKPTLRQVTQILTERTTVVSDNNI